jgi:hypothetical protein
MSSKWSLSIRCPRQIPLGTFSVFNKCHMPRPFLAWSTEYRLVMGKDHKVLRRVVFSTPCNLICLSPNIFLSTLFSTPSRECTVICFGISLSKQFEKKYLVLLCSGECLQHDNWRPHIARHTLQRIQDFKLDVLPCRLYSPESHRGSWIFVCCECRVLSGRGLCDELITRPEESYRLCCVVIWMTLVYWEVEVRFLSFLTSAL